MCFPRLQPCLLILALALPLGALWAVPPAPADGILDDARILSEANRQQLADQIIALRESTGMLLLVETATFRSSDKLPAHILRELREAWLKEKSGVVVSMTREGADLPQVQISPDLWSRYGEPKVAAMMRRAVAGSSRTGQLEDKLLTCVRSLLEDLQTFEAQQTTRQPAWQREELWLAGLFAGLLLLVGLVIFFLVKRSRRLEQLRKEVHLLPDVVMSPRLGAPDGGGTVVERSYRK